MDVYESYLILLSRRFGRLGSGSPRLLSWGEVISRALLVWLKQQGHTEHAEDTSTQHQHASAPQEHLTSCKTAKLSP